MIKTYHSLDTGPCDITDCDTSNTDGVGIDISDKHMFLCDKHALDLAKSILTHYGLKRSQINKTIKDELAKRKSSQTS